VCAVAYGTAEANGKSAQLKTNYGEDRIMGQRRPKSIALIVEDDHDLLQLTAMLLQESGFNTVECESAEAALAVMLLGEQDVAMVFADIRLSGVMDGVDLAHELKVRWPHLKIILTSGNAGERLAHLPRGVEYMAKPWRPLNVLMAAERARS
jgi:CheY-like chemotaxis protein